MECPHGHEPNAVRSSMKRLVLAILLAGTGAFVAASQTGADMPVEAEALLRTGRQAVLQGDYAAAIRLFEAAVTQAPREADAHHWLGNAYAWAAAGADLSDKPALGRKCLAAYRRALELDPDNLPARFSLMNFYRHVPRLLGGGLGRARAEAEEIGRRDAVQGLQAQAVLHAHEKDYAAAFAALDEVRRKRPDDYASLALFGRVALESGQRHDEGVAALRRCLELTPADTDESHAAVEQCLAALSARRSSPEILARRP